MAAFETLAAGPFDAGQLRLRGIAGERVVDAEAARHIEERWQAHERQAEKEGHLLFNGPAAWLKDWAVTNGPDVRHLHLHLAPTDYKTFLVTVLRDRGWFETHAPRAMTAALGNSMLLTQGDRVLLGVRSGKVAAYAHHAHLIGGVVDHVPPEGPAGDASLLLEHIYLELREELGVREEELARVPRVLGLFRDTWLAQPELVWHGELKIPLDEVAARCVNDEHSEIWVASLAEALEMPQFPLTPVAAEACRLVLGMTRK